MYDKTEHSCLVGACIPPAKVLSGITVKINIIAEGMLFRGMDISISEKQNSNNSIIY